MAQRMYVSCHLPIGFARVISLLVLAERYSENETELVFLAVTEDCLEILSVSAGMKTKRE